MRALALLLLTLVLSICGWCRASQYIAAIPATKTGATANTWTLVQAPVLKNCTASPCSYTVTIGAGHVAVVCATIFDGADYITGVSGGGTWVLPATSGLQAQWPITQSASCAYTLNSASASSISVTMSLSDTFNIGLMEASFSGASATFDAGAGVYNSVSTASPSGVTATLSGTSDFIFQWIGSGFQVTAISSGYTFEKGDTAGNADAIRLNQSTMPQPTWTQAAGSASVVVGGAFK